jgi:hypothetical protein
MKNLIPIKLDLTYVEGALVSYALDITHVRPELVTQDERGNLMPTSELGMLLREFKTRVVSSMRPSEKRIPSAAKGRG